MSEPTAFAQRIRERYPEGLTGIIAVGGTRTTYILEHNRTQEDPGHIQDFQAYAQYMLTQYFDVVRMFFELGGQHLILPVLSYQLFYEKGPKYAKQVSGLAMLLTTGIALEQYTALNIDPYFVGIDTLHSLPESEPGHQLALGLEAFQKSWDYRSDRHKLIWEVAPIPLFSFWQSMADLSAEERAAMQAELTLSDSRGMDRLYRRLFQHFAERTLGTDLPIPHFYLGSSRNGDLKLRSLMPIAMLCGGGFRLFYVPYASTFIRKETFQTILEDLAFGVRQSSKDKMDYSGQLTNEVLEAEYQRVIALSSDPLSTIGLSRNSALTKNDDEN